MNTGPSSEQTPAKTGNDTRPSATVDTTKITLSDLKKIHTKSIATAEEILGLEPGSSKKHEFTERRRLSKLISRQEIVGEKEHKIKLKEAIDAGEKDPVTEAYNLRGFNARTHEECSRLMRLSKKGITETSTVLYGDGDEFKLLNDTYGHAYGDQVLRQFANAIREAASRETDIIARIGGDEFALILPGMTIQEVIKFWNEELSPVLQRLGLKMSFGASELDFNDPILSRRKADTAMYTAKGIHRKSGINEFRAYSGEPLLTGNNDLLYG